MNLKIRGRLGASLLPRMFSAAIVLIASDAIAASENVGFEAPSYSLGSVVGQNGWFWNGYSAQDGSFAVSDAAPLSGLQSARYERSTYNFSDISLGNAIAARRGAGTDLSVSYLYSAGASSFGGLFIGPDGINGWAPIFVEFRTDGNVYYGENFAVHSFEGLTYTPNDVLSVKYEVDFTDAPGGIGTVTYRFNNLTTAAPEFSTTKSFFAGWGPEGTNGEYMVDVSLVGRQGVGQFDNINLSAIPEPSTFMGLIICAVTAAVMQRGRK